MESKPPPSNSLGGLREVEFRAFDFDSQQRNVPLHFKHALEIVAGHGTIAMLDDKPHVHLHLAVAYQDSESSNGIVVLAGHTAKAIVFATRLPTRKRSKTMFRQS